jgi:Chitobiase/beta-hexosaminidase C-terminal domain
LVADLSNGRYTYDIRTLNGTHPTQFQIPIEKTKPEITITLPATGLYDLVIADDLKTPRIDLFIAALTPEQAAKFRKSFNQVHALMTQWNDIGFGWPVHDFQRAYLESLMQDSLPRTNGSSTVVAADSVSTAGTSGKFVGDKSARDNTHRDVVTAEPAFIPQPGVFNGDTAVVLRCATPGASIHFTADSSEPTANSPVYTAPIMVKGTGLTIRSFASAPGKKDSAVVTGIYRVHDQ